MATAGVGSAAWATDQFILVSASANSGAAPDCVVVYQAPESAVAEAADSVAGSD
jgi:hypothetical protein